LKSRELPWRLAQKLTHENYVLKTKWSEKWRLNKSNPDKFKIIKQLTERVPGFPLPYKE